MTRGGKTRPPPSLHVHYLLSGIGDSSHVSSRCSLKNVCGLSSWHLGLLGPPMFLGPGCLWRHNQLCILEMAPCTVCSTACGESGQLGTWLGDIPIRLLCRISFSCGWLPTS